MSPFPHEYFMNLALQEARRAQEEDEVPIGAVIVSQNQVIGKGYNQVERLNDVTAHAEIIAITAAANYFNSKYLKDCTLYISLEPCLMCAAAIGWAQIQKIVFGASDPKKGFRLFSPSPLHPKAIIENGILEEECAELVNEFFRRKRR
ncbi:MAG: nucleoside deaminase [Chitinophagales bacterium]